MAVRHQFLSTSFILLTLSTLCTANILEKYIRDIEILLEKYGSGDDVTNEARDVSASDYAPVVTDLEESGWQLPPFRIGAFNIQIFGDTKYSKDDVVAELVQILSRYDILLVQEIRDSDGDSFPKLVNDLNEVSGDNPFDFIISERLGSTSSKEQYAYLYRINLFKVTGYQYEDVYGQFERPPFAAIVESEYTALKEFILVGIHTKPDYADKEIDALVDVYDVIQAEIGIENVVMMGDFNGDCSYVTSSEWLSIRLWTDALYTWLIPSETDTTVSNTDCAYDRFVVAGQSMLASIMPNSAKVYRFDYVDGLTQDEALDVSDHFPIEFFIYGKVDESLQAMFSLSDTVSVTGGWYGYVSDVTYLVEKYDLEGQGYTVKEYGDDLVVLTKLYIVDILNELETLESYADLIPNESITSLIMQIYLDETSTLESMPGFPGIVSSGGMDGFTLKMEFYVAEQKHVIHVTRNL